MAIDTIEENENLEQQKIAATENFLHTLQLDPDNDGEYVAAIVEDLVNRFPDEWLAKLDDIMIQAHSKADKSVQNAMFYLGDIVSNLDLRLIKQYYADEPKEIKLETSLSKSFTDGVRRHWDPNRKRIAGVLGNDFIPDWWTYHEAAEGKYDAVITQYMGGNVRKISEILNGKK